MGQIHGMDRKDEEAGEDAVIIVCNSTRYCYAKDDDKEYQASLESINKGIEGVNAEINKRNERLTDINVECDELDELLAKIKMLGDDVERLNDELESFQSKYSVSVAKITENDYKKAKENRKKLFLDLYSQKERINIITFTI